MGRARAKGKGNLHRVNMVAAVVGSGGGRVSLEPGRRSWRWGSLAGDEEYGREEAHPMDFRARPWWRTADSAAGEPLEPGGEAVAAGASGTSVGVAVQDCGQRKKKKRRR